MFKTDTAVPGLSLVLANVQHADALFQLVDRNRTYLRQWLPWLDHNTQVDDSEHFLRGCQSSFASQSALNTLIFFQEDLIGTVGYNSINHANHDAEIGYWMSEDATGRGFMTEAVRTLITLGFQEYGLNRQVIRAATGNRPSRAVAERLGFTHEGCARQAGYQYGEYHDLEIYSLLKSDWQK